MGKFSEAILHYMANIDQAPDKTLTLSTWSSEIYPAYEVMFNHWLQSKETKVCWCGSVVHRSDVLIIFTHVISMHVSHHSLHQVRLATVVAIGAMMAILPKEQFEAQIPKLVPQVLMLYKKEKEHLPITQVCIPHHSTPHHHAKLSLCRAWCISLKRQPPKITEASKHCCPAYCKLSIH